VKVKGTASPFDGNLLYWARRLQQSHPLTMSRLGALLYKQQGKCRYCELRFRDGDLIEIDHITPLSQGGKDERSNLAALHRHCHDQRRVPGIVQLPLFDLEPMDLAVGAGLSGRASQRTHLHLLSQPPSDHDAEE
jgi:5-methylcytosine-specific restriction endonuclease McrA